MVDQNSIVVQEFLLESFENLAGISEELTRFEKRPDDKELLNSIYRKVHTLKGSASFLGLQKLQAVAHAAENVLDLVRESKCKIHENLTDTFLKSFDACLDILKSIESTGEEGNQNFEYLIKEFEKYLHGETEIVVPTLLQDDIVESLKEFDIPQPKIETSPRKVEKVEIEEHVNHPKKEEAPVVESSDEGDSSATKVGAIADSVVRVNVKLLDKIMNVVGELVLNRNQILQFANNEDASELTRLAQQLNIITTELQTDIMTTRMQPVGSVFSKFERIVRDLSRSQRKRIKLNISGKETELDKTLLEAIRDPLTHLVRNAIDHGIEAPAARESNGKKEEGTISIKAYHEGGQVTIEISDDGNGIDPEKILNKAISKGLVSAEKASSMSKRQILNMIFLPGFSTAEQVTNISGRGVGMDVVKSNIEKIGGSVDIHSVVGEGTSFKLKIPLTLAIVPALVVQSKEETFAIPQINLMELVRLEGEDSAEKIEKLHDSEFYRLRGELIPIFRLSEHLLLENEGEELQEGDKATNIAILSAEGRVYGLIVDTILDTEEIVVKPLSRKLKDLSIYGGATIMGDGRVALIIDALGFLNHVDKGHGHKTEQHFNEQELTKSALETDEILLCSLGDRREYGVPLCLVSRLEEFDRNLVEWSGDQAIIRYRERPMPLLNLEKTMNLRGKSTLESDNPEKNISCIVVFLRNALFGLCVEEIRDIAINESAVSSQNIDREGILGTVFINEKTVTVIDVHKVVDMQKIGHNYKSAKEVVRNRGRILLVDDSVLYQRIQSEHLKDIGYEVDVVSNGREALDRLNKGNGKYDIVLTDIEMPEIDGWELVQKVRSLNSEKSKIPIIGLSGSMKSKDLDEGQRIGFNFMLDKMNQSSLDETVASLLSES